MPSDPSPSPSPSAPATRSAGLEPVPASGEQVELRAGELRATVAAVGASLRELRLGEWAVLDGYGTDEPALDAQGQALAPWPNRLAGGRYAFAGREHQLPLTDPDVRGAIHGLARWRAFTVAERTPDRVALTLTLHPQAGYPFALTLTVEYALTPDGVTVTTTARNAGRHPLPYGCGFHPYLRVGTDRIDAARLRLPAATWLPTDERGVPTGERRAVAGGPYDFRSPRPIGVTELDTAFTDLERDDDGRARVRLEAPAGHRAVTLWLDERHTHVMAFTGDSLPEPARRRRSLGVEPMTCPPNALATGEDVQVLDPGAVTTSRWGLELSA